MDIRRHTVPDYWGRITEDTVGPKIREVLDNIKRKGIVYINRRECVTGYAIHELYDWDLYFETLFLSHFGVAKYCRNNVETFLDIQESDGYVSRAAVNRRQTQHFKPFLAQRPRYPQLCDVGRLYVLTGAGSHMPLRRKHPRPRAGVLVLCRCNNIYGFVQKKTKKKHSPISLRRNICYNDEEERHLPLSSSEYPDGVGRASPREHADALWVSKEFYGKKDISGVDRRRALFGCV